MLIFFADQMLKSKKVKENVLNFMNMILQYHVQVLPEKYIQVKKRK
jgi:hypothetical protein